MLAGVWCTALLKICTRVAGDASRVHRYCGCATLPLRTHLGCCDSTGWRVAPCPDGKATMPRSGAPGTPSRQTPLIRSLCVQALNPRGLLGISKIQGVAKV